MSKLKFFNVPLHAKDSDTLALWSKYNLGENPTLSEILPIARRLLKRSDLQTKIDVSSSDLQTKIDVSSIVLGRKVRKREALTPLIFYPFDDFVVKILMSGALDNLIGRKRLGVAKSLFIFLWEDLFSASKRACFYCDCLPGEIPGKYFNFDADPNWGGRGIPLCPTCLGTGIILSNEEFSKLQRKAERVRDENLSIQIKADSGEITPFRLGKILLANNGRLIDIADDALYLVKKPVKGCYAAELFEE